MEISHNYCYGFIGTSNKGASADVSDVVTINNLTIDITIQVKSTTTENVVAGGLVAYTIGSPYNLRANNVITKGSMNIESQGRVYAAGVYSDVGGNPTYINNSKNYINISAKSTGTSSTSVACAGGFTIQNYCSTSYCNNYGNMTADGLMGSYAGGVFGDGTYNHGNIVGSQSIGNCINNGNITAVLHSNVGASNYRAAGIVPFNNSPRTFTNCFNYGKITGPAASGLITYNNDLLNIYASENVGQVSGVFYAAGMVGFMINSYQTNISSCKNYGEISAETQSSAYALAGGFVGELRGSCNINYSINNASVSAKSTINDYALSGGFVAWNHDNLTIQGSKNAGMVSGAGGVNLGGFVAFSNGGTITINSSYTTGDVKYINDSTYISQSPDVGTFIGHNSSNITVIKINNCYDNSNTTGNRIIGAGDHITHKNLYYVSSKSGSKLSGVGIPKTVEEMKTSKILTALGSNFSRSHARNNGFPYLYNVETFNNDSVISSGGSGTASDPFRITTMSDLQSKMNAYKDGYHFSIMNNLDGSFTSVLNWNGVINGNGYTLSGNLVYLSSGTESYKGLIGKANGSVWISNLNMEMNNTSSSISPSYSFYQGGLIGIATGSGTISIVNCNVNSRIYHMYSATSGNSTNSFSGGFIGVINGQFDVTFSGCHNYGAVGYNNTTSSNYMAGGMVARISASSKLYFYACSNTGAIYSRYCSGGLIGYIVAPPTTDFKRCFNKGAVVAPNYSAGFFGNIYNTKFNVENCYNLGSISTNGSGNYIGGLVGDTNAGGGANFYSCYSAGSVSSSKLICGYVNGNITCINTYYNSDLGTPSSGNVTASAATTAVIQSGSLISSLNYYGSSTAFAQNSRINNGYPYLNENINYSYTDANGGTYSALAGLGTSSSPFQIATPEQMWALHDYPSAYFKIVNELEMGGMEWQPVENFTGNLNGQEYLIFNLSFAGNTDYVGLMKDATNATFTGIRNINPLLHSNMAKGAGILVANNAQSCTFNTCIVDGLFMNIYNNTSTGFYGGIVSKLSGGGLTNCGVSSVFNKSRIFIDGTYVDGITVGGIAALNNAIGSTTTPFSHVFNTAHIKVQNNEKGNNGNMYVAGIVANTYGYNFSYVCNTGNIYAKNLSTEEARVYISGIIAIGNVASNITHSEFIKNYYNVGVITSACPSGGSTFTAQTIAYNGGNVDAVILDLKYGFSTIGNSV